LSGVFSFHEDASPVFPRATARHQAGVEPKAADKLRGNRAPSDYKHVAPGPIFLKYISDAFESRRVHLLPLIRKRPESL
jgi:hypothetical protein